METFRGSSRRNSSLQSPWGLYFLSLLSPHISSLMAIRPPLGSHSPSLLPKSQTVTESRDGRHFRDQLFLPILEYSLSETMAKCLGSYLNTYQSRFLTPILNQPLHLWPLERSFWHGARVCFSLPSPPFVPIRG